MSANGISRAQTWMQLAESMKEEEKQYLYKGVLYPTVMCPEENMKGLDQFQARPDDLMLVAYPKCGFNWTVGVIQKINDEATGSKTESKVPPLLEFLGPEQLKLMEETPSPRILGTHLHPENIPDTFYEKKVKMLVVFRNPKDTLVSYYHFYNNNPVLPSGQSWDSFFSSFMKGEVSWGSYFEHALAWDQRMSDPNVKVITYEELKQDLSSGVADISSFFGFSLTQDQVRQIAEGSTFRAMKENARNSHPNIGNVIFRKGEVGDWKNHFTAEQSKEMDEVFQKQLAHTKLGAKLNYQQFCQ